MVKTTIRPFPMSRSQGSPEQRANRWLKEHWTGCRVFCAMILVAALAALTLR